MQLDKQRDQPPQITILISRGAVQVLKLLCVPLPLERIARQNCDSIRGEAAVGKQSCNHSDDPAPGRLAWSVLRFCCCKSNFPKFFLFYLCNTLPVYINSVVVVVVCFLPEFLCADSSSTHLLCMLSLHSHYLHDPWIEWRAVNNIVRILYSRPSSYY